MKRGEIYYANLNPTIGSEVSKRRPVLIISNNANNLLIWLQYCQLHQM